MGYRLSRRASAQIDEIVRYTDANFGLEQTESYLSGLEHRLDLLSENPLMGSEWTLGKRRYLYGQHIIYYRVQADYILVTEIMSAKQRQPE